MFRGTTPTLYFNIKNADLLEIKDIQITIKSYDKTIVKTLNDVNVDEKKKTISLDLTQIETLALKEPEALVQLKVLFDDDKIAASKIFKIPIENPLNAKIIESGI